MKYYCLQHGHSHSENTLHAFDTVQERDVATAEMIFGKDNDGPDELRQWELYKAELNDTGSLEFEGDPGLEWFTAHPAKTEMAKQTSAACERLGFHGL